MYHTTPDITEEYLLKNLSQEQIMEHYLGVPVKIKRKFSSPFRDDKHPSCSMMYKEGRLIFKDFASNLSGNFIHMVMHKHNLKYYDALDRIAEDFNLKSSSRLPKVEKKEYKHLEEEKKQSHNPTKISIKHRSWNKADKDYWFGRFKLTRKILRKFNVIPVTTAWIDDYIIYNYFGDNDPCYAYRFGKNQYKLYFPLRKRGEKKARFLHNTQKVQGYRQLPKTGKYLIFTKSLKDVMVLDKLGVNAVALPAESVYPDPKLIAHLRTRFRYIYSFYDYDYAGICMANFFKREYNIRPLLLTDGTRGSKKDFGAKDISEYVENHSEEETIKLIALYTEIFNKIHAKDEENVKLTEDNTVYY